VSVLNSERRLGCHWDWAKSTALPLALPWSTTIPAAPCWRPENEVTTIPEMAALGRQAESSPRRVGRERLRPDIAPGTLHAVRVWETRKNWAECTRGD
jgi:hypothetical protein